MIKDLLLATKLTRKQVAILLSPYGFRDIEKADANLQEIAENPKTRVLFASILENALIAFSESPDPDMALNNFERFSVTTLSKIELLHTLEKNPLTLAYAAKIFGGSYFLADILIRNPEYFYWVFGPSLKKKTKTKTALRKELSDLIRHSKSTEKQINLLRIFKRKEIFRIGVRDMLQVATVKETLKALSNLADILIEMAHIICEKALRKKYGRPALSGQCGNKRTQLTGFTVLALGKLGSRELNFSSDVDLIYLYDTREGKTSGAANTSPIQNALYYEFLAKEITAALNKTTGQGYVYRVDLRLRPEGEMGLIAMPFAGYRNYYQKRGATWERMVLLRARPVSGDRALGRAFLKLVIPFVYEEPFAQKEIQALKNFKEQIDTSVELRGELFRDVKRGFGGIREIEFIVQALQLLHGEKDHSLRECSTIESLKRLKKKAYLSDTSEKDLRAAYLFLRNVENKLQMLGDRQTHLLPAEPEEINRLALRLGYRDKHSEKPATQFRADYKHHTEKVHQAYLDFFYFSTKQ